MNEDPLAQLRDIHVPESIGWWPPAPGWWILAALVIIAIVAVIIWRYRLALKNRYRGEAVAALESAWKQYQQGQPANNYLSLLTRLLKRTALTAYPKLPIEGLHGQAWLTFLDASLGNNSTQFIAGPGRQLLDLPYQRLQREVELASLHQLALQWLANHQSQAALQKTRLTVDSAIDQNTVEVSRAAA